ncbi:MAG: 50S ribosomal protein L19 [Cryobacterium sp.]|nr:50S ribosomal protein L19 [Oligoflexia bacterium]
MSKVVIKRKNATKSFHKGQKNLDAKIALVEKGTMNTEFPDFRAGDNVKVNVKIKEGDKERVQAYEGLVIAMSGKGASRSFTVRKMSHGVGVERIFLFSSQKIAKVEIVQRGKVRRAKLYYIRALEGRAAKIERQVETQAQMAASAAAKAEKKAESKK